MEIFTAVIVDDEAINILLLKKVISQYCLNIEIIGEALDIETAVAEINIKKPDVVFLDVMLKEGKIFEVIDRFESHTAQIIFVTSEENYAITAFKYNAADYIMKPIQPADVIQAVNKVAKRIQLQNFYNDQKLVVEKGRELRNIIAISSLDKVDFLKVDDIMLFTGDGKYTCIQLSNGKKYFTTKNLGDYERTIDNPVFFRIHHSYIINMNYVAKITKKEGSYCEMSNGLSLPIAKRRQDEFNKFIRVKD